MVLVLMCRLTGNLPAGCKPAGQLPALQTLRENRYSKAFQQLKLYENFPHKTVLEILPFNRYICDPY